MHTIITGLRWIKNLPKKAVILTLKLYRKTLSPDSGWISPLFPHGVCKFHPTCSTYTQQAVEKYGITRGLVMGARRIGRCHPWSNGGFDPVP